MSWTGLKKKWELSDKERLKLIEPSKQNISIVRQCELLGINRSNFYYQPTPVSSEVLGLMNRIDEIYTEFPYYGSPRITAELHRRGFGVNHKAIERLMRVMGIQGIYPKKRTTIPHPDHLKYPYLLNGVHANRPNHIWGTDITYVRAQGIWFYLVAILDWYSRYVLAWKLSPVMTVDFCAAALSQALTTAIPEFHNSDQGSQFTSEEYISLLAAHPEIKISMDGRGRCFDNIFTERLWRTVKYEEVYLHDYRSEPEANGSLGKYFHVYNTKRLHQSLDYHTPAEIYFGTN